MYGLKSCCVYFKLAKNVVHDSFVQFIDESGIFNVALHIEIECGFDHVSRRCRTEINKKVIKGKFARAICTVEAKKGLEKLTCEFTESNMAYNC